MAKRKTNPFWVFCTVLAYKLRQNFEASRQNLEFSLGRDDRKRRYYLLVKTDEGEFIRLDPPFSVKYFLDEVFLITFEQCLNAEFRGKPVPTSEQMIESFLTKQFSQSTHLRLCSAMELSKLLSCSRFLQGSWLQLNADELGAVSIKVSLCGIGENKKWRGSCRLDDIFSREVLEQISAQMRLIADTRG